MSHPQQAHEPVTLTPHQIEVGLQVSEAIKRGESVIVLQGPGGVGKTQVTAWLADLHPRMTIAAATHKAKTVLEKKLRRAGVTRDVHTWHAATMKPLLAPKAHPIERWLSELVEPTQEQLRAFKAEFGVSAEHLTAERILQARQLIREDRNAAAWAWIGVGNFMNLVIGWTAKDKRTGGVLCVDEASMVTSDDLKNALRVFDQVVMVGDDGQLPPIAGRAQAAFLNVSCRFTLTENHRHRDAAAVLDAAMRIRNQGATISQVLNESQLDAQKIVRGEAIAIAYKNDDRKWFNDKIRRAAGFTGEHPQIGELLQIGVTEAGFVKGQIVRVVEAAGNRVGVVDIDATATSRKVRRCTAWNEDTDAIGGLGALKVRFAYCLTGHSAQGSEWPTVYVYPFMPFPVDTESRQRWAYTAVTRAAREAYRISK